MILTIQSHHCISILAVQDMNLLLLLFDNSSFRTGCTIVLENFGPGDATVVRTQLAEGED
jgi:hypothetical protein